MVREINQISGTGTDTRAKQSAFLFQNVKGKNKITRQKQLKKNILKISKNTKENTCAWFPSLKNLVVFRTVNLLKKLHHRGFLENLKRLLKATFFTKNLLATAPDVASNENNSFLRKKLCG